MAQSGAGERALPLVESLGEAVRQAERIREARESGLFRKLLRKSNSSVQEWVRVPTPAGFVYVSAKMGGHVWDTLDTYYGSAKDVNAGYAVRAFEALGARETLPGEAELREIEAQIGQRVRDKAKVLVLPGGPAEPRAEQTRRERAGPRPAPGRAPDPEGQVETGRLARVFRSGQVQLVHLPEGFGLEGEQVRIRRHGRAVLLEPLEVDWDWLDALPDGGLDEDFRRAADEGEGAAEERPAMERLFAR